ncbi:MAG: methylated-DNA--[protein]-cysteine S-methyltransferase [Chthoniobacterales bacterium]|nr:methylated-DNA--[protein]-cysteine S-methyltransferase [Chthoniobacterales bacterium]
MGIHALRPAEQTEEFDEFSNQEIPNELTGCIEAAVGGEPIRDCVILCPKGTMFQFTVWQALLDIPAGQIRTYQEVAQMIGKEGAVRAVGAACAANPIPFLIPCHRVVASDGSLGGYSLGLELKQRLLELEREKSSGKVHLPSRVVHLRFWFEEFAKQSF